MDFSFENKEEQFINEMNMTPLIDVMLVLLIIFMITVPVMMHSVDVNLPQASSRALTKKSEIFTLSIDEQGGYVFNNKNLNGDDLLIELQQLHQLNPATMLHIYGDKKVPYEYVAKAMSMAHSIGIEKLGFVTTVGPN